MPYAPDEVIETLIGYPNPNRGYGYGSWVEFYGQADEARARMAELVRLEVVEWIELRKADPAFPLLGRLIDEWHDGGVKEGT